MHPDIDFTSTRRPQSCDGWRRKTSLLKLLLLVISFRLEFFSWPRIEEVKWMFNQAFGLQLPFTPASYWSVTNYRWWQDNPARLDRAFDPRKQKRKCEVLLSDKEALYQVDLGRVTANQRTTSDYKTIPTIVKQERTIKEILVGLTISNSGYF